MNYDPKAITIKPRLDAKIKDLEAIREELTTAHAVPTTIPGLQDDLGMIIEELSEISKSLTE